MTLTDDETRKLIQRTDGQPLSEVVALACEMLTLRIVLMLKTKARGLAPLAAAEPVGSVERANLSGQVNALKRFSVELTEAA